MENAATPQLRALIPEPTREEFDMIVDPETARELDFTNEWIR